MDDVFSAVKTIFPEVPDEELAGQINQFRQVQPNATPQEIMGAAQKIRASFDASSAPAAPMQEAAYVPTPEEAITPEKLSNRELSEKYLKQSMDPDLKKRSEAGVPAWADWLKYTPRGGRIHSSISGRASMSANKAKGEISDAMELAKYYQGLEGQDIQNAQESRAATEFSQKQEDRAGEGLRDSPSAVLARNMLGKLSPDQKEQLAKMSEADLNKSSDLVKSVYSLNNQRLEAQARLQETRGAREQKFETDRASLANLTPGQKSSDEKFAKEYVDWNAAGGYTAVESDLSKLQDEVLSKLDPKDTGGNRLGGLAAKTPIIGETFTPERTAIRENLASVVQKSMRQIIGAQFTEKEGTAMIDRAYNPMLSDAENYKRVSALFKQIKGMAAEKDRASKYYEANGTLTGYQGKGSGGASGSFDQGNSESEIKTVNGKDYKKVPGGWQVIK